MAAVPDFDVPVTPAEPVARPVATLSHGVKPKVRQAFVAVDGSGAAQGPQLDAFDVAAVVVYVPVPAGLALLGRGHRPAIRTARGMDIKSTKVKF